MVTAIVVTVILALVAGLYVHIRKSRRLKNSSASDIYPLW